MIFFVNSAIFFCRVQVTIIFVKNFDKLVIDDFVKCCYYKEMCAIKSVVKLKNNEKSFLFIVQCRIVGLQVDHAHLGGCGCG